MPFSAYREQYPRFMSKFGFQARFVELALDDADVIFSDNFFDVLPGEQVEILCPIPGGWTVDDLGKSLTVFSLYDSFA